VEQDTPQNPPKWTFYTYFRKACRKVIPEKCTAVKKKGKKHHPERIYDNASGENFHAHMPHPFDRPFPRCTLRALPDTLSIP
jgi:hypothetical protein